MSQFSNWLEILRYHSENTPDKCAYRFLVDGEDDEAELSYSELDHKCRSLAAQLQASANKGDRALLVFPSGLDYITSFFGCVYAGIIGVTAYPPRKQKNVDDRNLKRLLAISKDCDARFVLTTSDILEKMQAVIQDLPELSSLEWIAVDQLDDGPIEAWIDPCLNSNDLLFLQYTSGSTSSPKGVMVSHKNLLHQQLVIQDTFSSDSKSEIGGWLPLFHDLGLIGYMMHSAYLGATYTFFQPAAFIQRPFRWLRAISKYRINISGGPDFSYQACLDQISDDELRALDLSCWTHALTGAEPVRANTIKRFYQRFNSCGFQQETQNPCYGLAEATLIVSGFRHSDNPPLMKTFNSRKLEQDIVELSDSNNSESRLLASSGRPLYDQDVQIVCPETFEALEENQIGEIWLSGDSVCLGYWNNPTESQKIFQAHLTNDSSHKNFLRTGDLGFLHEGFLYIGSRLKDLIIIRGRNCVPQDIEESIERAHDYLRPAHCAAFSIDEQDSERLVIVCEVTRGSRKKDFSEVFPAIKKILADEHQLHADHIILIQPLTLPKTTSGKVQRRATKNSYLEKQLKILAQWKSSKEPHTHEVHKFDLRESIKDELADILNCPRHDLELRTSFSAYGMDSLQAVELSGRLEKLLDKRLPATLLFDYPTLEQLFKFLVPSPLNAPKDKLTSSLSSEPVAILGMACRFPGANNLNEFWDLLVEGRSAISEVPAERWPAQGEAERYGGFISNCEDFDASFFGISPREAQHMDPQQRILLETSYRAFEHAGLDLNELDGQRVGVFIGASSHDFSLRELTNNQNLQIHSGTGCSAAILAGRLSYYYNFTGPCLSIDTACSSSLTALHQAKNALKLDECDLAVVGAVNLLLNPETSEIFAKANMLAPDGKCKTFDAAADGYVRGEGCGVIILKKKKNALQDGNPIQAYLLGSAINQDGRSNGLTAPNGQSQCSALATALTDADIKAKDISYFEAHGTGTSLGDPIEMRALQEVLTPERTQALHIASVKTQVGHLEAAAGMAGLIKTILSMQRELIPAQQNFTELNPKIELSPLISIPLEHVAWKGDKRKAGVSSLGFSGTNAFVILESSQAEHRASMSTPNSCLLALSAKSERALQELQQQYIEFLQNSSQATESICFHTVENRSYFPYRKSFIAEGRDELIKILKSDMSKVEKTINHNASLAFLFSGQGSQHSGRANTLYETEPVFKEVIDQCAKILEKHLDIPLKSLLFDSEFETSLNQTLYTQPAIFSMDLALAHLWIHWGFQPKVLLGHSLGEYVALHLAEVMSLETALELVCRRATFCENLSKASSLLAVSGDPTSLQDIHTNNSIEISSINSPESWVFGGSEHQIEKLLQKQDSYPELRFKKLEVSRAFHTSFMSAAADALYGFTCGLTFKTPKIPIISSLSGELMQDPPDSEYFKNQLISCVNFSKAIQCLQEQGITHSIECGAKSVLKPLFYSLEDNLCIGSFSKEDGDWTGLQKALAQLFEAGYKIPATAVGYSLHKMIELPHHPFNQTKFSIPSLAGQVEYKVEKSQAINESLTLEQTIVKEDQILFTKVILLELPASQKNHYLNQYLQQTIAAILKLPQAESLDIEQPLNTSGMDSLMALELKRQIESELQVDLSVSSFFQGHNISQISGNILDILARSPLPQENVADNPVNGNEVFDSINEYQLMSEIDTMDESSLDALLAQMEAETDHE